MAETRAAPRLGLGKRRVGAQGVGSGGRLVNNQTLPLNRFLASEALYAVMVISRTSGC